MWWLIQARRPRARQNAAFCWAPHASSGRGAASGRSMLAGTYPRERRSMQRAAVVSDRHGAHERVVRARLDRPVVRDEGVGDGGQPIARIVVAERDRLVRDVAAREHERVDAKLGEVGQQHVMERCVREHDAELGQARSDRGGDRGAGAPRREHDRPRARRSRSARSASPSSTSAPAASASRAISANGRSSRRLRSAQLAHRALVGGRAGEVVPADALDGQQRAVGEEPRGRVQRVARAARRRAARRRGRAGARAGRRRGRRSAARGSGGRPGRRTRAGTPRTSRSRPSSSPAGRRARRARS